MIDAYDWSGGREAMLRFGPATGPVVIAAMPLFEEANRTRAFMAEILRGLAERGIASALPDLPGSGDSLIETEQISLSNWKEAFSSAASALRDSGPVHAVAIRGGALLDHDSPVASRWHFAPATGAALVRDMFRTRLAAAKEDGEAFDASVIDSPGPPVELAGNRLSRALLADLNGATPSTSGPLRTVRLDTDAQAADLKLAGAPLWRRAEPGNDPALADRLAADIAAWITTCGV
ncbi:hypothetical protein [Sphingomonas alpina]|uniref:Alpha/beta hydrolase n=1 Tax=Sphingomonas alpina TaxID=653931 RepID=A0A7H0LMQ1_9SPHN|nr:hypothetical protein [Sphingomonas alpina]QNQ10954.1 hypothetical protein H3Z74_07225 [Sphingomonas alpina]